MKVAPTFITPETVRGLIATSRERAARFAEVRRLVPQPKPTFEVHLLDEQRHARALQEIAMRNDRLRGLPSCFGSLE